MAILGRAMDVVDPSRIMELVEEPASDSEGDKEVLEMNFKTAEQVENPELRKFLKEHLESVSA